MLARYERRVARALVAMNVGHAAWRFICRSEPIENAPPALRAVLKDAQGLAGLLYALRKHELVAARAALIRAERRANRS